MKSYINNHPYLSEKDSSALIVFVCGEEESEFLNNLMISVEQECQVKLSWFIYSVNNWNDSLSPWPADPVFGKEAFGGLAKTTVNDLLTDVTESRKISDTETEIPVILCGYSLAGLFALWTAYQTDLFAGIAAVSPSVWFPNWIEYSSSHIIHTDYVYLSLGDREAKTRNPITSKVFDCIQAEYEHLASSNQVKDVTFELNPGNHFQGVEDRLSKALIWTVKRTTEII